jgi:hypothetical protein
MKHWIKRPLQHPLRKQLSQDDWVRIDSVLKAQADAEFATDEEIDAACDVLFDAISAKQQTHLGVLSMQ